MKRQSIFLSAMLGVLAVTSSAFAEIWFSEKGASQWIYRMTPDGTLLPRIATGETNIKDLTVIGDEVWFSGNDARIGRLDFDGIRLADNFWSHEMIGDFALVGDQIWITDADASTWIERWTLDQVELPRFNVAVDVGGLVVVDNEIWFSEKGPSQWIYRMTPDGTLLPRIATGETNIKDLTVIGDEVWFSGNDARIGRLDFDGIRLADNFWSHEMIGDFALVGDQIWITDADASTWIERWTLDQVELPRFNVGVDVGGLVVIPEPLPVPPIAHAGGPYLLDISVQQSIMLGGSVEGEWSEAAWDLDADSLFDDATGLQPVISAMMLESWGFSPGTTWDIGLRVTGFSGAVDVSMTELTFVPVPGAALLGVIGLSFAGSRLRRHRMS